MEKEIWIALPFLLFFFQWWGELGNEIFPNLPTIKWTEAGEGLTQPPDLMKTFWERTRIPQNNSHPTNYKENLSHFDDYMTLKMPVKPISLLQEHLPKILGLTVFSINQLPVKYEHANRDKSLSPEKLVLPCRPSPSSCRAQSSSRAFCPGSTMDVSICTLLTSPGRRAQWSSLSNEQKHNFLVFFLLFLPPPHIHTTHFIASLQAQLDGSRTQGLWKSSVTSILHNMVFLHKHMGFSSKVIRVGTTDKQMTDD